MSPRINSANGANGANGADEPPDGGGTLAEVGVPSAEAKEVRDATDPRVDVQIAASPAPAVDALVRWAAAALGEDARALCMRVVDAAEGAALNARFRGRSGATNVLSFPAGEPELLGDIAICAPVVEAEARGQRKTLDAHFAHMVVHGVLHLRGMDHDDDAGAARMAAEECAMLRSLGFRDPYAMP